MSSNEELFDFKVPWTSFYWFPFAVQYFIHPQLDFRELIRHKLFARSYQFLHMFGKTPERNMWLRMKSILRGCLTIISLIPLQEFDNVGAPLYTCTSIYMSKGLKPKHKIPFHSYRISFLGFVWELGSDEIYWIHLDCII